MMSRLNIQSFLIDDENEDKMAAHGLTVRRVVQVLDNAHLIVPNRKHRRGLYLIIGTDNGGACIAVPVESTSDATLWRPITAWACKANEEMMLERKRGD